MLLLITSENLSRRKKDSRILHLELLLLETEKQEKAATHRLELK